MQVVAASLFAHPFTALEGHGVAGIGRVSDVLAGFDGLVLGHLDVLSQVGEEDLVAAGAYLDVVAKVGLAGLSRDAVLDVGHLASDRTVDGGTVWARIVAAEVSGVAGECTRDLARRFERIAHDELAAHARSTTTAAVGRGLARVGDARRIALAPVNAGLGRHDFRGFARHEVVAFAPQAVALARAEALVRRALALIRHPAGHALATMRASFRRRDSALLALDELAPVAPRAVLFAAAKPRAAGLAGVVDTAGHRFTALTTRLASRHRTGLARHELVAVAPEPARLAAAKSRAARLALIRRPGRHRLTAGRTLLGRRDPAGLAEHQVVALAPKPVLLACAMSVVAPVRRARWHRLAARVARDFPADLAAAAHGEVAADAPQTVDLAAAAIGQSGGRCRPDGHDGDGAQERGSNNPLGRGVQASRVEFQVAWDV